MRVSKRAPIEAVAGARSMSWLTKLPTWRGVLVLAYHRIRDERGESPFDPGVFSATPATFDEQLGFLTRHFELVGPESIERDRDARGRRVALTFDDGYRDNYELAFPMLRKHRVPATFFLATGFLDEPRVPWWDELAWIVKQSPARVIDAGAWLERPLALENDRKAAIAELARVYKTLPGDRTEAFIDDCAEAARTGRCDPSAAADLWMSWEMAAEMQVAGMGFGGHSANHPVLARVAPETQRREVEQCARRLQEELGVEMRYFAYPVGRPESFSAETQAILDRAGVALAFSLYGGYMRPGRLEPLDVPRASVSIRSTPQAFRAMLALPGLLARW